VSDPALAARLTTLAVDHGPALLDLATRQALPADAPSASPQVRAAEAACLVARTEAHAARLRGELGEAEALEETAISHARQAAHLRDLGRLERSATEAAQMRAQILGLTLAAAKAAAPLLLAAAGV
jgi:hypothetical protein